MSNSPSPGLVDKNLGLDVCGGCIAAGMDCLDELEILLGVG